MSTFSVFKKKENLELVISAYFAFLIGPSLKDIQKQSKQGSKKVFLPSFFSSVWSCSGCKGFF